MKVFLLALVITGVFTPSAGAQIADPRVEVGATLATLGFMFDSNSDTTVVSVPSTSFNFQPGAYASVFVGRYFAIEPQLGLVWTSTGGGGGHLLNLSGQADVFVRGTAESSPYVFGAVGVVDSSGASTNPTTFGGGIGYRVLAGDRLTFRFEARFTHITDRVGNGLGLSIAIGGVFP